MKHLLFCLALGVFSLGYGQGSEGKILKITYHTKEILSKKADFETVLYTDDTHSQFVFDRKAVSLTTEEGYILKVTPSLLVIITSKHKRFMIIELWIR